nr:hypothetical protein [Tanacetum cinerariifolium]
MPPKMTTQSAGRLAAASRGGGTGGRASKGGGRTRGRYGDRSNSRIDGQGGQGGGPGSQGSDQGNGRNQNSDAVNDKIQGNVRNVIENNDLRGCTYKEFLACNQKEYDGKGGATVYTHWIKKMESVQNMSGCRDNQKVKYTAGSFVDFKTLTREEFCPSYEIQKLENGLWNHAMVEAGHAAYREKYLRPMLYDEKVIGLGYTLMFLTHSDEALEIEKFKKSVENKIEFAYDYRNLNASYQTSSLKPYVPNVILEKIIIDLEDEVVNLLEKEKANLETIESLKSKSFELSENVSSESENQSENDCLVVEKECDKEENPKVISLGMFKLNVSQCVSPISMSKSSCDSNNVEIKLKRKRRKRKSSKQNVKQVYDDVSRANSDFVYFLDLDTFSSVRRPKNSSVIWKKKGSSNTSNVGLSAVSVSNLNKNVKRYSRKDLLACNNSHPGETSSAYVYNDAMNVSCNSRMCDLLDDNNLFIFDDVNVRISRVSKMSFRKKPRDSMNVRSKSNMINSLPRTVRKWLPKMQLLAEPVIIQIFLWIIDSRCSKHMTGNRALLTNFVENFLETVRFGNNDFAVIAG